MAAEGTHPIPTSISITRLLHLLTTREQMLMVMASHPGANSHMTGPHGWALGGLLASQNEWERVEGKWRNVVSKGGLHRLENGNFAGLLEESGIVGIGFAVSSAAFQELAADDENRRQTRSVRDPQLLCFRHCVTEAAHRLARLPAGETVCFLLDWGDALASEALWCFEDLKNLAAEATRQRLGALGFESKRDFLLLQAAEWFAAECFQRLQAPAHVQSQNLGANGDRFQITVVDGASGQALPSILQGSERIWKRNNSRP